MNAEILHGDNRQVMANMPNATIDAIVTDPPYELGFMGKKWDASGIAYQVDLWMECLRILKPGGHLLAFGGTRTYHRMAVSIEDAGFEIRDSIHWVYGSGFPKSLNIGKAIDKAAGAERLVVAAGNNSCEWIRRGEKCQGHGDAGKRQSGPTVHVAETAPATPKAQEWSGWGTALKPAHEPIVMARKPLNGTVVANVLEHGTGGLNIDACRVGTINSGWNGLTSDRSGSIWDTSGLKGTAEPQAVSGRWPANVVFDRAAGEALDQQSGVSSSNVRISEDRDEAANTWALGRTGTTPRRHSDSGGASRFFTQADFGPDDWPFVYQAKPSRKERNAGLESMPKVSAGEATGGRKENSDGLNSPRAGAGRTGGAKNYHPTVKPIALMRHLARLVTPPGGTILDPFAGSGTTLIAAIHEGFNCIGIELQEEYIPIIQARIKHAQNTKPPLEFNK